MRRPRSGGTPGAPLLPWPTYRERDPRPVCGGCGARMTAFGGGRWACRACHWGRLQASDVVGRERAAARRRLWWWAGVAFAAGAWCAALAGMVGR